jgi:hypothetical protein
MSNHPHVTDILKPLTMDKFAMIPKPILDVAIARGIAGHKVLENYILSPSNKRSGLEQLYQDGLDELDIDVKTLKPETELNSDNITDKNNLFFGKKLQGTCDANNSTDLGDHKFTAMLGPEVALQEVAYDILLGGPYRRKVVNHFCGYMGLMVHQVIKSREDDLREFYLWLLDNHEEIMAEELLKIEAIMTWEKIQEDGPVLELVAHVLPPPVITSPQEAEDAVYLFDAIKTVAKHEKLLKAELLRYMDANGCELEIIGKKLVIQERKGSTKLKVSEDIIKQYVPEDIVNTSYVTGKSSRFVQFRKA